MSFYPIDLSQYCNHKLVYSGVQEGDDDSVGLDGEYIDEKDLKIKPNDEIGGVPFRFVFGDFDNVQCDGQTIKVDQFANRLHVLGFAYWGDTFDIVRIRYCDGAEEPLKIPFIDWAHKASEDYRDRAFFGKNIFSARYMITSGKGDHLACLHHCILDLAGNSAIEEIILPDNLFLHVTAITLEKNN